MSGKSRTKIFFGSSYLKTFSVIIFRVSDAGVGKERVAESRQLLMQFTAEFVSLQIQSLGRSIAELQISGAKANLTKRPYDSSLSLSVHSLLVVDALQQFGTDFELLVASNKHIW